MHELSIAMSIVEGAAEEALRHGADKVAAVYPRLGLLSGVVPEALQFSYDLACEGTPLEGSRLEIEEIEPTINCLHCRGERAVESIKSLRCAECGTLSFEVIKGRELVIVGLELEGEYAAASG
jgi:hydrogenase nickel incorporation protein HypA/HybF